MDASITIRLDQERRNQLRKLAAKLGKTDSELVREMIEKELVEESVGRRLSHLKGILTKQTHIGDSLCESIRERNWRAEI